MPINTKHLHYWERAKHVSSTNIWLTLLFTVIYTHCHPSYICCSTIYNDVDWWIIPRGPKHRRCSLCLPAGGVVLVLLLAVASSEDETKTPDSVTEMTKDNVHIYVAYRWTCSDRQCLLQRGHPYKISCSQPHLINVNELNSTSRNTKYTKEPGRLGDNIF